MKEKRAKRELKPGQLALISKAHKIEKKHSLKKLNDDLYKDRVISRTKHTESGSSTSKGERGGGGLKKIPSVLGRKMINPFNNNSQDVHRSTSRG